jgi:hypothetical protein
LILRITQYEATAKQYGEVFKVEIASDLLPEPSNLATLGQDDGPCVYPYAHTFALKAFKQHDQDRFKSEMDVLKSMKMKSTIGKVSAKWIRKDVLELDYVACTNLENDNRGHSRSSPHSSQINQSIKVAKDRLLAERIMDQKQGEVPTAMDRTINETAGTTISALELELKRQKRQNQRMLACPYFKHDPVKYRNQKTCCGPGFAGMHRVK